MIYSGSNSGSGSSKKVRSDRIRIHNTEFILKNVATYSSVDLVTVYKVSKISETSTGTVDPDPELFGIVDTGT
jgi:hypothetical protein